MFFQENLVGDEGQQISDRRSSSGKHLHSSFCLHFSMDLVLRGKKMAMNEDGTYCSRLCNFTLKHNSGLHFFLTDRNLTSTKKANFKSWVLVFNAGKSKYNSLVHGTLNIQLHSCNGGGDISLLGLNDGFDGGFELPAWFDCDLKDAMWAMKGELTRP